MATVLPSATGSDARERIASGEAERSLFRFGLRQLLLFVSAAVALLGAMASVGGSWGACLGFLAALVAAHVLATVVGTHLRDASPRTDRRGGAEGDAAPVPRFSHAELQALTATPLARHERAPVRTLLAGGLGLLGGAFGGAAVVPVIAGPEATGAGIALGAASCGIMGAWVALAGAHFWSVARRTWRDANGAPCPGSQTKRA